MSTDSTRVQAATALSKYAAYLRKVYLRSKLPARGKWPPSPCKKIIKLAAIERKELIATGKLIRSESVDEYMINNSMMPISMEDLLLEKNTSPPKLVVVQGVPGIGKSTFAWKICRKWAKGKIYQKYKAVVLLRMRDTRVREAQTLSDVFGCLNPHDKELAESTANEVAKNGGKGVLFLFEGLDEFPSTLLQDEQSLLVEILQGLSLPEVTVLLTSRPWAVQKLVESCGEQISLIVEILGFTKEDIMRYISYAFDDEEKAEFLGYLHSHPQLESIMHIPLNAAFVVQIYKQFKRSQQVVPHTLTQLYTALVKGLLLRHLKSSMPDFQLITMDSLPEPIKSQFQQLCQLAFMSFTKLTVPVTFTDSEAAMYGCFDSLGLMQSSANLSIDTGTTVTHSFLHFTIQEFLAAYHLFKEPEQVRALFVEVHQQDPQFEVLIKFLIGLSNGVVLWMADVLNSTHVQWLYESQSPEYVCKCLGNGVVLYDLKDQTQFDLHALTYCICHSNCKWKLAVDMSKLTTVVSIDNKRYTGKILQLLIHRASSIGLKLLFSLPKQLFSSLYYLWVQGNDCSYSILADLIQGGIMAQLKILCMYELNSANILEITNAVETSCRHLTDLTLCSTTFDPSNILPLCAYISSRTKLSALVLFENSFARNSLQILISAIPCSKSLTTLQVTNCNVSAPDMEMLSVALSNSSVHTLYITICSLNNDTVEALVCGLENKSKLRKLSLYENCIGKEGAVALSTAVIENISLKTLNVVGNEAIGTEGAMTLINALEYNTSLETLYLPASCEPIEYQSFLMKDIRKSNRVSFHESDPDYMTSMYM